MVDRPAAHAIVMIRTQVLTQMKVSQLIAQLQSLAMASSHSACAGSDEVDGLTISEILMSYLYPLPTRQSVPLLVGSILPAR
jgi:hypothetical protein